MTEAPALKADPNVFAAHFLSGMEAVGFTGDRKARVGHLMLNWHVYREFVEAVGRGEDRTDFDTTLGRERAEREKVDRVATADKVAADAARAKRAAEWNAKQSAPQSA